MNTEQNINRFDELIREKLNSYEAEPDMDLLMNIHARKNRFLNSRNLIMLMILLAIVTAGVIGGYLYKGTRLKQSEPQSDQHKSGYHNRELPSSGYYAANSYTTGSTAAGQNIPAAAQSVNTSSEGENGQGIGQAASTQFFRTTGNAQGRHNGSNRTVIAPKPGRTLPHAAETSDMNTTTSNVGETVTSEENIRKDDQQEEDSGAADKQGETTTCKASFDYYTSYDEAFHFMAGTNVPAADVVFKWAFGDGTYSSETNPKHTYAKPGQYAATLTAFNPKTNCKAEVYKLIRVTKGVELTSSSIKGTVFADAEYAGKTLVQLIAHNSTRNTFEVVQTTLTNAKGQYEFTEINAGDYLVKSAPYKNYYATYYGNSTDQEYATDIIVFKDDFKVLSGYDIQLASNRQLSATSQINADSGSRVMIILDENNQPLVTVMVSANGTINMPLNLPSGDYNLMDPETGKIAGKVSVDEGGAASSKTSTGSSSGSAGAPGSERSLVLAPNPASDYVRISLTNSTQSQVQITIINSTGSVVQELTLPGGTNVNTLNLSHLTRGTYYVMAKQDGTITLNTLVVAMDSSK